MGLRACREQSQPSWRSPGRSPTPLGCSRFWSLMTPYHTRLCHDHVHWYIKLISRNPTDQLQVESQAGRPHVRGQLLDRPVEVSSPPDEPIPLPVPDDAWHKDNVHLVQADRTDKLLLGLENSKGARSYFLYQFFDLREEKIHFTFLDHRDENTLLLSQSGPDHDSGIHLGVLVYVTCDSSGADVLVQVQHLIDDVLALLLDFADRLSISET